MKESIIKYYKYKIACKLSMKEEIKRIDNVVNQLAQVMADFKTTMSEYLDDSYKTKFLNEHKKRIELEKETNEIIEDLTARLKKAEREKRKLRKEVNYGE